MRRHWKMIAILAALAVLALSVVAVASAASKARHPLRGQGACSALLSNPEAVKVMQDLRAEHRVEMLAWHEKYGANPGSPAARAALRELRQEHWSDMQKLLEQFGVGSRDGAGPGACGGGMMGGLGGCDGVRGAAR